MFDIWKAVIRLNIAGIEGIILNVEDKWHIQLIGLGMTRQWVERGSVEEAMRAAEVGMGSMLFANEVSKRNGFGDPLEGETA